MNYTPAMQQYIDTKRKHQDAILFFRIWDFYETFFEDAITTSKVLDLVLTSKNKNSENPIPMSGIPHHSVDKYIQKLVESGYKIAIAEQITNPVPWKIVEREVVSIITPWTYIQESKKQFNYILAITEKNYKNDEKFHITRWDFSIGEYLSKSFADIETLQNFIYQINPSEIVFDIDITNKETILWKLKGNMEYIISIFDIPIDPAQYIIDELQIQSIQSFGKAIEWWRLHATALLFNYIKHTQKTTLSNITKIGLHSEDKKVLLDNTTIKNLEIFNSSYEWKEKYSLVWILDNTKTSAWARLLRYMLANPTTDKKEIQERLEHIKYYQQKPQLTNKIHKELYHTSDLNRIIWKIIYKKTIPSNLIKIRTTLDIFFKNNNDILQEISRLWLTKKSKTKIEKLRNFLHNLIKEEINSNEINYIKDGFRKEIDTLRQTAFHSDQLLLSYQKELVKASGIHSIKIKFIKNQGYFIEITNKDINNFEKKIWEISSKMPTEKKEIIRRNTLKWAQRYSSPYLDKIEQQIFIAKDKLIAKEQEELNNCKNNITNIYKEINEFNQYIAYLDLFTSHAIFAKENNYNKPIIHNNYNIEIIEGRHPVIEKHLPIDQQFINNNLYMDNEYTEKSFGHTQIITGPNMWWKSTFLRQNALIILLAHCGLYVPAKKANIAIVDGIFARVGSGDQIAKNQSTFMTEMIEVANILNNASEQSFIVFDELGRWTATYDGLALSKAILEYVSQELKCKTLIATHYHELIALENKLNGVKNYSVNVYENWKEVVFMKKIIAWWANKSYGIQVAKLAGIATGITKSAQKYLDNLEDNIDKTNKKRTSLFITTEQKEDKQTTKIKSIIQSFDLNNITPLQALQILSKIKDEIKK